MADTTNTDHGSFDRIGGYWAARRALAPLARYTAMLNEADSETAQRESSTTEKIGATAGVVGAIAGIAGLIKPSGKGDDALEMDVINYSPYPIVPYKFWTEQCSLHEAPRSIMTGDNTLIRGSWYDGFQENESHLKTHFLVGSTKTITVHLNFAIVSNNQWIIDSVIIDDHGYEIDYGGDLQERTDTLNCISFTGKDDYPSFSVFYHTVMYATAKTFIIFTSLG